MAHKTTRGNSVWAGPADVYRHADVSEHKAGTLIVAGQLVAVNASGRAVFPVMAPLSAIKVVMKTNGVDRFIDGNDCDLATPRSGELFWLTMASNVATERGKLYHAGSAGFPTEVVPGDFYSHLFECQETTAASPTGNTVLFKKV